MIVPEQVYRSARADFDAEVRRAAHAYCDAVGTVPTPAQIERAIESAHRVLPYCQIKPEPTP